MMERYWQRCPDCKTTQFWLPATEVTQRCCSCGFTPGLQWELQVESKFQVAPEIVPPEPPVAIRGAMPRQRAAHPIPNDPFEDEESIISVEVVEPSAPVLTARPSSRGRH